MEGLIVVPVFIKIVYCVAVSKLDMWGEVDGHANMY